VIYFVKITPKGYQKYDTRSTLVLVGVKKGLVSHGEAHVRLKRVLEVQLRVAQNEVLILKVPSYM
jgi:hypothetical protein